MLNPKLKFIITLIAVSAFFALAKETWAAIYYVDGNLAADCVSGNGNYSISSRNCTGSAGKAYRTLVGAHNASVSGDKIIVRGGLYTANLPVTITKSLIVQAYSDEKPILDGADTYPTSNYMGLIQASADNVVIDGLTVTRSRSHGIKITANSDDCVIQNCIVSLSKDDGIQAQGCARPIIQDNILFDNNRRRPDDGVSVSGASIKLVGNGDSVNPPTTFGLVRRNLIYDEWGEGIGFYKGVTDSIMEYNEVRNCRSYELYISWAPRSTVRHNLVYQTTPKTGYPDTIGGIVVGDEPWQCFPDYRSDDPQIYGNMVQGGYAYPLLIRAQINQVDSPPDVCDGLRYPVRNMKVYNNVFIGRYSSTSGTDIRIETECTGAFKNNIIWSAPSETAIVDVPATVSFSHNYWSKTPDTDATSGSVGNIINRGDPGLEDASLPSWFSPLPYGTRLSGKEFALSAGSLCVNAGTEITQNVDDPFDDGLDLKTTNFVTRVFKTIDRDEQNSGRWSIGADVYAISGDTQAPNVPSGLFVR